MLTLSGSIMNPQVSSTLPTVNQSILKKACSVAPLDKRSTITNKNKMNPAPIAPIDIEEPLPGRNLPSKRINGNATKLNTGISQARVLS